jgi:hypothetical protein
MSMFVMTWRRVSWLPAGTRITAIPCAGLGTESSEAVPFVRGFLCLPRLMLRS